MSKGKILFQLSGSIACYKACYLLSRLVQSGYQVEVAASKSALEFVGQATLEGLTGKPVHTSVFERGGYMQHIDLVRWADLLLLCPATANTLAKMAAGVGDDLLTTLFLAHDFKKPYLLAPAMNVQMLQHPATQTALSKLRGWGVEILDTDVGNLACGEVGEGRLLDPDLIFAAIERHLNPNGLRVLVTSGGTREPIDGVRSIANSSTGHTGAAIAEHLRARGHNVCFLRAQGSVALDRDDIEYVTFTDLDRQLRLLLGREEFDAVIHAAAVSDYSVDSIETDGQRFGPGQAKIDSEGGLTIHLKANVKLVDQLRSISKNPNLKVVAFKLTNTEQPSERREAIKKLALRAHPDLIVHNDLSGISETGHHAKFYDSKLNEVAQAQDKRALAEALDGWLRSEAR